MSKIKINIDFSVKIIQGLNAISELENSEFREKWDSLIRKTKHSSVFQDASFVLPWYKEHINEYLPVAIIAFAGDNLVGLFTLARKSDGKSGKLSDELVGAGSFYAIYQSWLVLPGFLNSFWEKGIKVLLKQNPGCSINLKSLPHLDVVREIEKNNDFRKMTVFEKYHNPVLNFEDNSYQKVIGKRHFRSKYNRLSRGGRLKFERLNSLEQLNRAFNDIEVYYNLRQGAAFNKTPFPVDKNERALFLEWFKKGVLHATILWLDECLIGAVMVINDFGKTAHLAGLITYSPSHAKYSPGLVHLYLLTILLKEESFSDLKLSPGYDAYKERFSNTQEEIFELLISPSIYQNLKRKIRVKFREFVLKKGIRPMEVGVWVSKNTDVLKNKLFISKNPFKVSEIPINKVLEKLDYFLKIENPNKPVIFEYDNLSHLLLVDNFTFDLSRWEFLEDSLKRLEENQNFLTLLIDNKLNLCIWYEPKDLQIKKPDDLKNIKEIKKMYSSTKFLSIKLD